MMKITFCALFAVAATSSSTSCSDWFDVESDKYPTSLTYESARGTQTDVLQPQFKLLNTDEALTQFLDSMPSRKQDETLPSFDANSQQRVGIVSAKKACEYEPVLKEVVETKDLVQVKIRNETRSSTNCTPETKASFQYFVVVFKNTESNKKVTVLTESEQTS